MYHILDVVHCGEEEKSEPLVKSPKNFDFNLRFRLMRSFLSIQLG